MEFKKKPTVATSSTEVGYMASCHAMKEAVWLQTLLHLIGYMQHELTVILCNNAGSNMLTKDPSFHTCTKHIDVQHHYVCKCVEASDIQFHWTPTTKMPTDALTKALPHPKFKHLTNKLGIAN